MAGQGKARRLTSAERLVLAREYERGDPVTHIMARHGVTYNTVCRSAHLCGVPARSTPYRAALPAEQVAEALESWEAGLPIAHIAKRLRISPRVVTGILAASGVTRPGGNYSRNRGRFSSHWKGGRRPAPGGYVMQLVKSDDSMACMRQAHGYVLEHRLVMARAMGRPLRPDETVHHVNGDKTDNRLENLQLRLGAHGAHVALRCASCGSCDIEPTPIKEMESSL